MKSQLSSRSIRIKITIITLGFATLLAFVVAAVSLYISKKNLVYTQRLSSATNIQLLGSEIDSDMSKVRLFSNWISYDSSISDYLATANKQSTTVLQYRTAALNTWNRLNEEFYTIGVRDYIGRALISNVSGSHYIQVSAVNGTTLSRNLPGDIMAAPFFDEMLKNDGFLWNGIWDNPLSRYHNPSIIPIIQPIRSPSSSLLIGWVYIEVPTSTITNRMQNFALSGDSRLYLSFPGGGSSYVYEDGSLVPASVPADVVSYLMPGTGWTVSILPSGSEIIERTYYYIFVVVLIFSAIVLAGILMALLMRHLITRPVTALINRIVSIGQGDFEEDKTIEWDNEFGLIGRGINNMSSSITTLMEKKVQDEKDKQELNYKILQSQINPHFMYNTLNTIKWMATIQGADGISDIATALSRLLKNVAKGTDNLIPLSDEISLVNDYFTIMKYRYGGTIDLEYDIPDEDVLKCRVNRFTLQPIVENAIFHGIEPKGNAGKITIRCWQDENKLFIEVKDNGIGMDDATIAAVLGDNQGSPNEFFRHVGVSNVNKRIHYAFGNEYGISITSKVGEYSAMLFTLPATTEKGKGNV